MGIRDGIREKIPSRIILALLLVSTVAFALQAVLTYAVVQVIPVAELMIAVAVGFIIAAVVQARLYQTDFSDGKKNSWIGLFGAFMVVISILLLFIAYTKFPLTSVYPLAASSVVVFLIIDLIRYSKRLSAREIVLLIIGVSCVATGTFFAESNGLSFDMAALPYVFGIMVSSGLGFYGLLYDLKRHREGAKLMSLGILALLVGLIYLALSPVLILNGYVLLGVFAGMVMSLAIGAELHAMRLENNNTLRRDVVERNFINNFTYLDVLLVIVGGILIDSYTVGGIIGGVAIVIGVLIIGIVN